LASQATKYPSNYC